ncbi:adenylate/guanylate cyclase domain-containing protein [Bradyrhizobium jicamae]|uniref:Adenylate/guanylate cyclase domain-containing protein n=1 Tax=Bradyrhizobium jicamae TaxID=280332 RepID=A0ABS5FDT8_9BRAD|nr:adenylate/guanylate cyclase domain-containing protein [Bradyrhizobium jicamae]MBR0794951.1 adenylate/guanylate cyclase domain-containing protein [Bradyrhizobium jicamae]
MAEAETSRVGRRLAAIVAADVAGFSRLMGLDEVGTARTLREHRKITDAIVTKHGGRIVKTTGDGVLLEFPSVVDAVECAVAVQAVMAERNQGVPEDRRMLFRFGINLGDILIEGDDILGDGVNVAARLEGIAEPGGICVSSSAYEQVCGKVPVEFTDIGEQRLKNIARPIRAYAIGLSAKAHETAPLPSSAPRLSMVVLPFTNIGGDPEQDYFVDGVTESLTTDLSRISGAFVIGRHTAFTYRGKAVDLRRIGRELNIRYVLEGAVQRGGNRLRVNVQLIDAETGNHLWAERFDKPVADLFDMQDEIVSRLANTLDAQLVAAEAQRAERSLHPDVMDLYFQGIACLHKGLTNEHMTQARGLFERALALDPGSIEALVGTAIADFNWGVNFSIDDRAAPLAAAEATLIKALSMAPQHAQAHVYLGAVHIFTARAAQGITECEQALVLDRNLASAHGWIGIAKLFLGRDKETEAHIHEALRLSPRDIFAHRWMAFVGFAKLWQGDDAEAVAWLRRGIEANRNFPLTHFHLAAALAWLGAVDEARAAVQEGLALNPSFTIHRYRVGASSDNPTYLARRERVYEGMRLAGVPEG